MFLIYFLFRNNLVMHIYLLFISIVNLLNFQLVSLRRSPRSSTIIFAMENIVLYER